MFFYILEGIDGSGKSTQIEILKKIVKKVHLQDCFVFLFEPTNFQTGQLIRKYLKENKNLSQEEWLNLFDKDREENVHKNILPNKDKIIIMDRYYFSTATYQSKNKDEVKNIFLYFYQKYPKPNAVFYLDISHDDALKRIQKRSQKPEIFEKEQELLRILRNYEFLKKLSNHYSVEWINLNAQDNPYNIAKKILRKVFSDFQNKNKSSL
jgi:dTMP kinase